MRQAIPPPIDKSYYVEAYIDDNKKLFLTLQRLLWPKNTQIIDLKC
jgi:hypothetical protein